MPDEPFVYIIQAGGEDGPLKIGVARNPKQRLKQLQTGSPHKLTLRRVLKGGRLLERQLHAYFAESKLSGGQEWFEPHRKLLAICRDSSALNTSIYRKRKNRARRQRREARRQGRL